MVKWDLIPSSLTLELSFFFFNVYLKWGIGRERERERGDIKREKENPKQGFSVSTEPNVGLDLMNHEIMT